MLRRAEPGRRLGHESAAIPVLLLALLAAAVTVTTALLVFPHGTTDLDEVSYQAQANTLADGHLTLPASKVQPFFQPYLTGVRGDRVVFKYLPEWPALIAVSDLAFGSSLPLRAALGAAGVLAVAWLASELTRDRRVVLLAAALTVASPFTWMEAASLLSYQLLFVLGTATAAALIRAQRTSSTRMGVVAGVLAGLVAFHRPFDAVLIVGPVLVYVGWRAWRQRSLRQLALPVIAGASGPIALLALYNWAVMGAPWRLPFGVTGGLDTFGFGWRSSLTVPGTGPISEVHFTLGSAFSSLAHVVFVLLRFIAVGPVVVALVAALVWIRRPDRRVWLLIAIIASVFAGYFFWWSPDNAHHFGLDQALGPFYHYPVLAPIVVGAAWGAVALRPGRRAVTALALVAVAWSVAVSVIVVGDARTQGEVRTAQATADPSGPSLFVEAPLFPNDPYVRFANDARLTNQHLVAIDRPGRRLDLVDRYPDRAAYLQRQYHSQTDPLGPMHQDVVRLTVSRARALRVQLRGGLAPGRTGSAYMRLGNGPALIGSPAAGAIDQSWLLDAATIGHRRAPTTVSVGVTLAPPGAPVSTSMTDEWYECRMEARATANGGIEALTPCDGWYHYSFPGGSTLTSPVDLSHLLDISVTGA